MLARVIKSYEWYRHYNALVIVLLVGKIPKMKFLLSCTSSQWDLKVRIKYYLLEVQLCIRSRLCPILITVCTTSEFSALKISFTLLGVTFYMSTFTFIFLFGTFINMLADSQHTCVWVSNLLFMNCHSISQDITCFSYIIMSTSCTCYYVNQVR